MRKRMDKLISIFKIHKQITIFLFGLSIIGIITGALYITILNKSDHALIQSSVNNFVSNIQNNKINFITLLKNISIVNISFIILIWLLGISVIGIPIILFLLFCKSFILGFSVSSIILQYKLKGTLIAFIYLFPHHIINLYIYVALISYSMSLSLKLIDSILKRKSIDFKQIMNKYSYVLLVTFIIILITTLFEVFITPTLLKICFSTIKNI